MMKQLIIFFNEYFPSLLYKNSTLQIKGLKSKKKHQDDFFFRLCASLVRYSDQFENFYALLRRKFSFL